ncbi:RNA polymerase 3 subunit RPC82 family protein [Hibiscus syriacus]|uniref:RNA polymerase 3 subunit RPC82 family protein n=1 Tax=Hibiscus syriacus TaxID=106335 RepID=A0A6A2WT22_HIBSY|nr:RNA polymerase 3 subunit RPC82 family protein [Hibiscus syriacus]
MAFHAPNYVKSALFYDYKFQFLFAGEITCEHLDHDTCAYAVASTGKRCVLEKHVKRSGEEEYTCRTSEIEADKIRNWIETDQCVKACGIDRNSFGISSDLLIESRFTEMLCSPQCYDGCPNVVDLFFNLAAGEGVFLPKLCEARRGNTRRGMSEIEGSGLVATDRRRREVHGTSSGKCAILKS